MRVSGTDQSRNRPDDQRVPLRRTILWGVIGVAVIVGVILYFRYERVIAPLVSP